MQLRNFVLSPSPFILFERPGLDTVAEPHGLGPQLGVRPVVALVAGVGDPLGQLQPPVAVAVILLLGGEAVHAPGEAGQVVHLVLQPPVFPLGDVGQAPGGLLHQVLLDGRGGLVKHLLGLLVPLAAPEPLLEEILIEGVTQRPHARMLLSPLSSFRMEIVGIQTLGLLHLLHSTPDLLHLLLVDGVAGDVGQVGELHVESPEL